MKRAVLLPALGLIFALLIPSGQAIGCQSSLNVCQKTKFMTGECKKNICECVPGSTPGLYGCQKQIKPIITSDPEFDTQIQREGKLRFLCAPWGASKTTFFRDGSKFEDAQFYSKLKTAKAGNYTCKGIYAGVLSEESDEIPIEVVDKFTIKPKLGGMPKAMLAGTQVKLTCEGGGHKLGRADYEFAFHDGSKETLAVKTHLAYETFGRVPGKYGYCRRNGLQSPSVPVPRILNDILGVKLTPVSSLTVMFNQPLKLTCELTGGFAPHDAIKYQWKKGTDVISGESKAQFTKIRASYDDTGSYTCEAGTNVKDLKKSNHVTVTVKNTMALVLVTRSGTILDKGYYSLTCDLYTVNTSLPVTYTWYHKGKVILGVQDKVLQFSDPETGMGGEYKCSAHDGDIQAFSRGVTIKIETASRITANTPLIYAIGKNRHHGRRLVVGETYLLECRGLYSSPGMVYEWKVDGTIQNQASKTFEFKEVPPRRVEIECKYKLGLLTSKEGKQPFDTTYIKSVQMLINGNPEGAIYPLKGSKVKIECKVEKSAKTDKTVKRHWYLDETKLKDETAMHYTLHVRKNIHRVKCICEVNGDKRGRTITSIVSNSPKPTSVMKTGETDDKLQNSKYSYIVGTPVSIYCKSPSYAEGATFTWMKDNVPIKNAISQKYELSNMSNADEGKYTCKMEVQKQTSIADGFLVAKAIPDQIVCDWARDCAKHENTDPTICENKKCRCLKDYTVKLGKCVSNKSFSDSDSDSNAGVITGSLLLLTSVLLAVNLL